MKLKAVLLSLSIGLLISSCSEPDNKTSLSNKQLVRNYIEAFAAQQPEKMLTMVSDDIRWHYLDLNGISYSGSGKKQLTKELVSYFASTDLQAVEVLKIQSEGDWLTVFEAPTWLKDKQKYTQKGVAVYYIEDAKISQVWYYPAFEKQELSSQ
ncbi:nuclear transport factor 2 family protein [Kangiella sp. TOML190]|uniref:nuclear transport factor 2 family protein n=1 Tax=Kangiella sp. TOML190 TaxID=2931351 RepID=UPI0020400EC7|nr:nuclear transport factor 2 family protein [Kangiella sp. TOML190]